MLSFLETFLLAGLIQLATTAPADNPAALPAGIQFVNGVDTSSGMLASTTAYGIDDGGPDSACGCSGSWQVPNGGTVLTAATSFPIYGDNSGETYCGAGCGQCFELENTGNVPCPDSGYQGCGDTSQHKGERVIVLITNACPIKGNEAWCASPNPHGYSYHFDIAVPYGVERGPNGWGLAEVKFKPVSCDVALNAIGSKMQGSIFDNYASCDCAGQRPIDRRPSMPATLPPADQAPAAQGSSVPEANAQSPPPPQATEQAPAQSPAPAQPTQEAPVQQAPAEPAPPQQQPAQDQPTQPLPAGSIPIVVQPIS